MLPSGNDAAQCLAESCCLPICELFDIDSHSKTQKSSIMGDFYRAMNEFSEGMKGTHFCCCDGLSNPFNRSSALDIAILSSKLLQIVIKY